MKHSELSRCDMMAEENAILLVPGTEDGKRFAEERHRPGPIPAGRNFPLFRPSREIYIRHHHFGRVLEIGMGGIRFTYVARAEAAEVAPSLGMLFTAEKAIDGIPFEVLADNKVLALAYADHLLMERRLGFGELANGQLEQLESFILENVHIPRWS